MSLDENAGGDRLRFVLTDKTPSSDLQLVCQAPSDEVRQNWITQIISILDMQGDLLRGKTINCVFCHSCGIFSQAKEHVLWHVTVRTTTISTTDNPATIITATTIIDTFPGQISSLPVYLAFSD